MINNYRINQNFVLSDSAADYQEYLESLARKLTTAEFEVSTNISLGSFKIDLLGFKRINESSEGHTQVFCPVTYASSLTVQYVQTYCRTSFHFANEYDWPKSVACRMMFPVTVAPRVDDKTVSFVRHYRPIHDRQFEHPVIVELETKRVFHHDGPIIWGLSYGDQLNAVVNRYLMFDTVQKIATSPARI